MNNVDASEYNNVLGHVLLSTRFSKKKSALRYYSALCDGLGDYDNDKLYNFEKGYKVKLE